LEVEHFSELVTHVQQHIFDSEGTFGHCKKKFSTEHTYRVTYATSTETGNEGCLVSKSPFEEW